MPAPIPDDPNQLVAAGNGSVAEAASALDVLLGGPSYAVEHSAIHPHGHHAIQHPNPTHYERPAASPFPGGPAGTAGIWGRGRWPFPAFSSAGGLQRGFRK